MTLSNWFKRDKHEMTTEEVKTLRSSTVSLNGRALQMLEDLSVRGTRYSNNPLGSSRYYYS